MSSWQKNQESNGKVLIAAKQEWAAEQGSTSVARPVMAILRV